MIDSLLGRARLKDEIADLEVELTACREELDRLEDQLAGADRRRKAAVREGQEAHEERNRLEDRIEQLTDELARTRETDAVSTRGSARLGRSGMASLLGLLSSVETDDERAYTAMLTDGDSSAVREHFGERRVLITDAAPCVCAFDSFGVIEVVLIPPILPDPFDRWDSRFHLDPDWFLPQGTFHVALVRSDLFALGLFDGEQLAYLDGFESEVMGRHSKGGFSQARFERRREEQVARHLDRCRDRLSSLDDDRLLLMGSREAIDAIDSDARARLAVDASGAPRAALNTGFEEAWTSTVYRL